MMMFWRDGMEIEGAPELYDLCTQPIRQYKGPLDTVIDLGAHQGSVSLYAARQGAKKVIAVECEPENYKFLTWNIVHNGFWGTILPLPYCVTGLDIPHLSIQRMQGIKVFDCEHGTPVLTIPLVEILRIAGPVDYLKCDIEEAEYGIFDDTIKPYLKHIRHIDIELHAPYGEKMAGVRQLLKDSGFALNDMDIQHCTNPSFGTNELFNATA